MRGSPLRLSNRFPWENPQNRLTQALAERSARGLPTIDLTETNPMRVGLAYPEEELAEILRRGACAQDAPHPRGIPEAREALAAALSRPGDPVSPDDLVLTASTSESYSYLFKLFGDPGDEVLTAAPSYPLLDSLAALDSLELRHFHRRPGRRFAIDPEMVEIALSPRTRLLVLIHPGNPTGTFLSVPEQETMIALCASRGIPLISDEVFGDFPQPPITTPLPSRYAIPLRRMRLVGMGRRKSGTTSGCPKPCLPSGTSASHRLSGSDEARR